MAWHVSFVVFCFKCLLIAEYNGRDWRKTFIGMFMLCQVINRFEKSFKWILMYLAKVNKAETVIPLQLKNIGFFPVCFFFFFEKKPVWVAQSDTHLTGDQEVAGLIPAGSDNILLSWRLIWNISYGHSLPSTDSRRAVVCFWRKHVHKHWLVT